MYNHIILTRKPDEHTQAKEAKTVKTDFSYEPFSGEKIPKEILGLQIHDYYVKTEQGLCQDATSEKSTCVISHMNGL